jgi:hypothetical protein
MIVTLSFIFANIVYMENNIVFHFILVLINLLVFWIIFTLMFSIS